MITKINLVAACNSTTDALAIQLGSGITVDGEHYPMRRCQRFESSRTAWRDGTNEAREECGNCRVQAQCLIKELRSAQASAPHPHMRGGYTATERDGLVVDDPERLFAQLT